MDRRPTLRSVLRRQFVLLGTVPVVLVFATAWMLIVPLLLRQAETRHDELAVAVREQVQLQLQARERTAALLAAQLRSGLLDAARAQPAMRSMLEHDRFLQAIYLADERGRVVQAALPEGSGRFVDDAIGLDLAGQPPFAESRAAREPTWSDSFLSTLTGQITAVLAVPAGGQTVVLELSLAALSQSMPDLARNGTSLVVVTDRLGRAVAHPDVRQAAQQRNLREWPPIEQALAGQAATGRLRIDGEPHVARALPVPGLGWVVMVAEPSASVLAPAWRLGGVVLAVLAATIVLAAWIGMRLARRTGDQIARLADAAQAVDDGARPADFEVDEFNRVWARLRDLFTEIERREGQTREAQRQLRAVLDAATEVAIVATDARGMVTVFSIGAQRMLGWTELDVVGSRTPLAWHDPAEVAQRSVELSDLLGRKVEGFEALVAKARSGGFELRDWTFRRRDGRTLAVSQVVTAMRPGSSGELPGYLAVAIDVTERRRAEALEQARRSAELASQAKSDFLSRMSHELRTPMNAILGYAQLMAVNHDEPLAARQREAVDHIQRAGWHLVRLIDDVLDLASIEAGRLSIKLSPVELRSLLQQARQLVKPLLAPAGLVLSMQVGEDLRVLGDETRLVQVLLNLLGNAVKYNRPGGTITLDTRVHEGKVLLRVIDTGVGMSAEQLARLFEPFNRLGAERSGVQGTGIGLVIARHLIELMNGRLEVQSRPGEGTTFTVQLPLVVERVQPAAGPALPAPARAGTPAVPAAPGLPVLYIEDNPVNVELMRAMLNGRGELNLQVADSVSSGVAAARATTPALILLDLHLPDGNGEDVMVELRADPRLRPVPVIVVSADANPSRVEALMRRGARAYLTKPIEREQLLRAIDAALAAAPETQAP